MAQAIGYAAKHSFNRLRPMTFECDDPKAGEVEIDILFCGVCHSDIHQVKNEWGNTVYPCMPGHRDRRPGGARRVLPCPAMR